MLKFKQSWKLSFKGIKDNSNSLESWLVSYHIKNEKKKNQWYQSFWTWVELEFIHSQNYHN